MRPRPFLLAPLVAGALVTSAGCQTRRDFRAAEVTEAGSRLDVVEEEAPLYRAGSRVRLAWRAGPGAPALQVAVARDGGSGSPRSSCSAWASVASSRPRWSSC